MSKIIAAFAFASAVGMAVPAHSQSIEIGPGGVRIVPPGYEEPYRERARDGITRSEAVRIAQRNGVRHVEYVEQGRRSFEVGGRDRRDRSIIVFVSRRDGAIVDVERPRG